MKATRSGGGRPEKDDVSKQVVPLSLQKMRDLAESLKASMPVDDLYGDDKVGATSTQKSKALARSKSTAKGRKSRTNDGDKQQQLLGLDSESLQLRVGELEAKMESLSSEHNGMLIDGKKQQQDFIRREIQYKSQIKRMKELLEKAEASRGGEDVGMPKCVTVCSRAYAQIVRTPGRLCTVPASIPVRSRNHL